MDLEDGRSHALVCRHSRKKGIWVCFHVFQVCTQHAIILKRIYCVFPPRARQSLEWAHMWGTHLLYS